MTVVSLTRNYPSSSHTRCDKACCQNRRQTAVLRCISDCRVQLWDNVELVQELPFDRKYLVVNDTRI